MERVAGGVNRSTGASHRVRTLERASTMSRFLASALMSGAAIALSVSPLAITANASPAGQIQEDDPGWDCRIMGDLVCGPTNSQGVAAGRYADGILVQGWDGIR